MFENMYDFMLKTVRFSHIITSSQLKINEYRLLDYSEIIKYPGLTDEYSPVRNPSIA